jgi:outer membrane protein OmpA-like peptidoglycan-associated protein
MGQYIHGIAPRLVSIAAILVVTLALAPGSPASRGQKGDWEVGLFAGYAGLDDYEREGTPALNPDSDVLYGARGGYFFSPSFSLETAVQRLSTRTNFTDPSANVDVTMDSVRLNALYNILGGESFRPFLTVGAGYEFLDADGVHNHSDPSLNAGAGLRWFVGRNFGARIDARFVHHNAGGDVTGSQSNFEATFGVLWAFGGGPPPDTDGDGVPDKQDRCPGTPRGALVDEFGCPIDSDGDGVSDGIDKCPGTPRGATVDEFGCPMDNDGDGVYDGVDLCPRTPRGAMVDERGCPLDSDGDGVPDGIDQCPGTPQGAVVDGYGCPRDSDGDRVPDGIDECPGTPRGAMVDERGCPIDSDGDGVPDGIDQCPDTAPGTEVNARGCPVLFLEGAVTLVLEDVGFEFDSAELTAESLSRLDGVAASLQRNPDVLVEVAGHTDSLGNDAYNLALSQRRADAVREYLVSRGVDGTRLVAKGYGETRPVADNATEEGRGRNRRVALRKMD